MKQIKNITFEKEERFFSEFACFSKNTIGRDRKEEPDLLRTEFQRDRDRIIHCKAFRRLKNKTQVFLAPKGDHYRTRITHTLDVTQIGRSIARALRLNEDLVEAMALGHDLGHPPFGHTGERALNKLTNGKFLHNEQSVRIVEFLENEGKGLNLTKEVRDGILNHRSDGNPMSLEGRVVMFADKIAYTNHDVDDAIRAGLLSVKQLPQKALQILGKTTSERINNMIMSIYRKSSDKPFVEMEEDVFDAMKTLRQFLFESVYVEKEHSGEGEKAERLLTALYNYLLNNNEKLPAFFRGIASADGIDTAICDYIASMSDNYAINLFTSLYVPEKWEVL